MADQTLFSRLESLLVPLPFDIDTDAGRDWINNAIQLLSLLIPQQEAYRYTMTASVPDVDGFDLRKFRFFYAHKDGRQAFLVNSFRQGALGSGLYKFSEKYPVCFIKDGKLFIKPDGGEVEALGIPSVETLHEASIPNLPPSLETAALHYTVIQLLSQKIYGLRDKLSYIEDFEKIDDLGQLPELTLDEDTNTLELKAWPLFPEDLPDINFTDADKETLDDVTLTSPSLPADAQYTKADVTVPFTDVDSRSADDDIEMLRGEVDKIRAKLDEFQGKMADEMNRVRSHLTAYESLVQHSLQNGQLNIQKDTQIAAINSETERFNRRQAVETALGKYRTILEDFRSQVEATASENQTLISEFTSNVQAIATRNSTKIEEFRSQLEKIFRAYELEMRVRLESYNARLSGIASNLQTTAREGEIIGATMSHHQAMYQQNIEFYLQSVALPVNLPSQPIEEQQQ